MHSFFLFLKYISPVVFDVHNVCIVIVYRCLSMLFMCVAYLLYVQTYVNDFFPRLKAISSLHFHNFDASM